ncbi:MAG: hypothetical protein ACYC96_05930 [Fimbriimonadaceae bacterium]
MSRLRNVWPALALLFLTLLPLWRCVGGGEKIGAWDEIGQLSPWHAQNSTPWDVLQADSVLEFYGWRDQVFSAWGKGHLPLWNHYELNGTPLLANSQSGAMYPPHILVGLLRIPTAKAMALLVWAHLFLAAIGVYALCRKLGGGQAPAFLGAAGFALSPFMLGWVGLPSVTETVAWIPWALLGVYCLPSKPGLPILAAAVAMSLLAGHLQFAAYGLIAVACALIVRAVQVRPSRKAILGLGFLGVVAGILISGPQLIPVLSYGRHSHRQNTPTADGFAAYNAGALPAWELLSMPDSRLLGLPTDELDVKGATVNAFWPALIQRGGNFAESAVAVGPVILMLVIVGIRRSTLAASLGVAVAGVVGLLLAVGSPLGALLYFGVPGWSATGSPGRAGVLLTLALCVIAGCVNLEAEAIPTKVGRDRLLTYGAFVAVCVATVFRLPLTPWLPTLTGDDIRATIPHSSMAAATLGLALAVAVIGVIAFRIPKTRPVAAIVLACVIAMIPGSSLVRSSAAKLPNVTTTAQRIAIVNGPWDLVQAPNAILPPNTAELMGIHEAGGYDSIIDKRTRDSLADIDGEDPAPAANGNMMFVKKHFDPAKLADAGVTEVWSGNPLPQLGKAPVPTDGIYKYPLPGPGRGSMSNGPATLMRETAEWLEFEATGPGVLTVRDHLREGWSVRIDDVLTNFTRDPWPRVVLPPGRHTVRFQCWPPGLTTGFQALALGLAIIAIYMFTFQRSPFGPKNPVVQ